MTSVHELARHLYNPEWVIVDCRAQLSDPDAGRAAYLQGHIPGAVFTDLNKNLSGPPLTDCGRHPLPSAEALVRLFGRLGISPGTQVVAYDAAGGALAAARLWWLLRFMGHEAAAILDGGWPAWQAVGLPVRQGEERNAPALFDGRPDRDRLVLVEQVSELPLLIDCRDAARYRGEMEPIDRVAGHIPGALNLPYGNLLGSDDHLLPPELLRQRFEELLGGARGVAPVFYCGSGVTSCLNILALEQAGLGSGRLYAGSWSEWSADLERPVSTGAAP